MKIRWRKLPFNRVASSAQKASLVAALGLLFLCWPFGRASAAFRVQFLDGEGGSRVLRTWTVGKVTYIPASDLAEALGARTFVSSKAPKFVLYFGGENLVVTALNPFVVAGTRTLQMFGETLLRDGEFWVPEESFCAFLAGMFPDALRYVPESHVLQVRTSGTNILAVEAKDKANGTLIHIRTSRPFKSEHVSTRYSHGWLYVDIYGGKVDSSKLSVKLDSRLVRSVVPLQLGQTAQLSFRLRREVSQRKVYCRGNPPEILVSLRTAEVLSEKILETLRRERRKWLIDAVVIDPGHGGHDPGSIGRRGTYEKDVTLAIAKRLKRILERDVGVKVYMTRSTDRFVPLKDRTKFANEKGAKLFISIHANANRNRRVHGVETYFLGPAKTEEAREVARLENSAIRYEDDIHDYKDLSDENFILAALAQNSFNHESQDLAALIQRNLVRYTGLQDRGVRQAGYYVLIGAAMPNVLVETAFISNPREERLLKDPKFQEKVARAIASAVRVFKRRYEKELAALR
ncbi:MAG TPA: N-acetylmuramoyl-L-alanine amidase [Bacteroidetes bacterium]|nr:N-acetylmuramoyl-L-alanine amidase [Bacteroidota bacterium]